MSRSSNNRHPKNLHSQGDYGASPTQEQIIDDLLQEKAKYIKRGGTNYRRGSNIACLYFQDSDQMKEPTKPSHRVRKAGLDIMHNANVCSWYEAMMTEDPHENGVRGHPGGAHNSKRAPSRPLMPSPYAQDDTDCFEAAFVKTGTTNATAITTAATNPNLNKPIPGVVVAESVPSLPPLSGSTDPTHNQTAAAARVVFTSDTPGAVPPTINDSTTRSNSSEVRVGATALSPSEGEEPPVNSASNCSVALSEANLSLLKRLEEQQIELMKQQQALSQQLGLQQKKCQQGNVTESLTNVNVATVSSAVLQPGTGTPDSPITRSASVSASEHRYAGVTQRRLKGAVAQRCAQRNEGSIKNLIWFQAPDSDDGDGNNNKPKYSGRYDPFPKTTDFITRSYECPNTLTRKSACAVKAENSKTVQDLISNSFS